MKTFNKLFKKLFLVFSIFLIFSFTAFAKGSFEFILNGSIGLNISTPLSDGMKKTKFPFNSPYLEFGMDWGVGWLDAGVLAQLGYMFHIKENLFGISVLGELGYSRSNYDVVYANGISDIMGDGIGLSGVYEVLNHSLQIGLLPKFNIKNFSIGIGGGIKIPMLSIRSYYVRDKGSSSGVYYSIIDDYENATPPEGEYRAPNNNAENRKNYHIYYAKITFDYSIFFAGYKAALNIGVYLEYDFLPKYEFPITSYYTYATGDTTEYKVEKLKNYGTFNIGVQFGFRFGENIKL